MASSAPDGLSAGHRSGFLFVKGNTWRCAAVTSSPYRSIRERCRSKARITQRSRPAPPAYLLILNPSCDLLSTLVADWRQTGHVDFEELVNQIMGIVIGGTDTTRAAFAMLLAQLLRHPDQLTALRADPAHSRCRSGSLAFRSVGRLDCKIYQGTNYAGT